MLDRLQDVALVVLGVLAAVLIALAFRHQGAGDDGGAGPLPVSPATTGTAAEPSEEPSAEDPEEPAEPELPEAWAVGFRDRALLVRAPASACEPEAQPGADAEGALLVSLPDRAARTEPVTVDGLVAVSGVVVDDAEHARLIGSAPDCATVGFATEDAGVTWRSLAKLPPFWSLLPGDVRAVMTPDGRADVPCSPVAVSGIDGRVARLSCADGKLLGTSSAGADWVPIGRLPDALAMVFTTPGDGWALAESEGCDGVAVLSTADGGTTWEEAHCSPVPGPWGLAADGDVVKVLGLDQVDATDDAGDSWTQG